MIEYARWLNRIFSHLQDPLFLIGRVLLCFIFFNSGFDRLTGGWDASVHFMQSHGVPPVFLPFATALEFFGGLFLALGFLSRLCALGLGIFSVSAAFLFFGDFSNDDQWISFLDNIAIAGGMLLIIGAGPGRLSLDYLFRLDRKPTA
ncbi:DoxX family protein [Roseibium aggregatum]|uniref:DoxX family protein n=1 Tax=Roseibium aggregatum TaxID=187304 RepID=A0A939J6R9_9HYPH|nr:DoxX family protein [Roseibium aggregatum]MBN9673575.1 DoxX family protein [Roseibium aggregatum]